jgi:Leucine-rich repeat (LRR) protein
MITNLEYLNLRNNELQELTEGIFDSLTNLQILALSGNQLSSLPKSISKLKNLRVLAIGRRGWDLVLNIC